MQAMERTCACSKEIYTPGGIIKAYRHDNYIIIVSPYNECSSEDNFNNSLQALSRHKTRINELQHLVETARSTVDNQ